MTRFEHFTNTKLADTREAILSGLGGAALGGGGMALLNYLNQDKSLTPAERKRKMINDSLLGAGLGGVAGAGANVAYDHLKPALGIESRTANIPWTRRVAGITKNLTVDMPYLPGGILYAGNLIRNKLNAGAVKAVNAFGNSRDFVRNLIIGQKLRNGKPVGWDLDGLYDKVNFNKLTADDVFNAPEQAVGVGMHNKPGQSWLKTVAPGIKPKGTPSHEQLKDWLKQQYGHTVETTESLAKQIRRAFEQEGVATSHAGRWTASDNLVTALGDKLKHIVYKAGDTHDVVVARLKQLLPNETVANRVAGHIMYNTPAVGIKGHFKKFINSPSVRPVKLPAIITMLLGGTNLGMRTTPIGTEGETLNSAFNRWAMRQQK